MGTAAELTGTGIFFLIVGSVLALFAVDSSARQSKLWGWQEGGVGSEFLVRFKQVAGVAAALIGVVLIVIGTIRG